MSVLFKAGSCTVCGHGTDTGLAFQGEPEWCIAALMQLGVTDAEHTFRAALGVGRDDLLPGFLTTVYRLCSACSRNAGFPAPGLLLDGSDVPCIGMA